MDLTSKNVPKMYEDLIFPKIDPENGVGLYLTSKMIEREQRRLTKPLDFDKARDSVALDLIKSQRILTNSEEKLRLRREKYAEFHNEFDKQMKELQEKANNLKSSFISFDEFIKENYEKRERSQQKIAIESKLREINEKAIQKLTKDKQEMNRIKNLMREKLKNMLIYENYLNSVVENHKDIKSIDDLLNDYKNLMYGRNLLFARHDKNLRKLEDLKDEMKTLLGDKSAKLIGLEGKYKTLEERYIKANRNVLKWEQVLETIRKNTGLIYADIVNVKDSIQTIYSDMYKRSNRNKKSQLKPDDFKGQLEFIKSTLKMLDVSVQKEMMLKEFECLSV
nr:coiled-coil domain-containing protein 42 homolog [Onthophagus taurus]